MINKVSSLILPMKLKKAQGLSLIEFKLPLWLDSKGRQPVACFTLLFKCTCFVYETTTSPSIALGLVNALFLFRRRQELAGEIPARSTI